MKYLLLIILLLSLVGAFGLKQHESTALAKNKAIAAPSSGTAIHLKVAGYTSGQASLIGFDKNKQTTVDSAQIDTQGHIFFKRDTALAEGAYVVLLPDSAQIQLLLDQDQVFNMETTASALVKNMQVNGSKENELLYGSFQYDLSLEDRFNALVAAANRQNPENPDMAYLQQQRVQILSERELYRDELFNSHPETLFTSLEKARQQPEILQFLQADTTLHPGTRLQLLVTHFWDNVDFRDDRLLHTPVVFNKLISYLYELVPPQTGIMTQAIDLLMNQVTDDPAYYRFFAEWIAQDFRPDTNPMLDPEALYVHMVANYLTSERAFWADSIQVVAWQMRAEYRNASLLGKKAANIVGKDPHGVERSLYQIEAPYTAVYFYHPECDHCIAETPHLVEFYQQWKTQGIAVFAVALGAEEAIWKEFVQEHQMDWPNVNDQDNPEIYQHYSIPGTPDIYLLDADKKIIGKHLVTRDLPGMIAQYQATASMIE